MIIRYIVRHKENRKYYSGCGIYGRIFSEDINDVELFRRKRDAQKRCHKDNVVEKLVLVVGLPLSFPN